MFKQIKHLKRSFASGQARFFAVLACAVTLSLPAWSQGKSVTLSSNDIVVSEAFKEIGSQTGYNFGYSRSRFDVSRTAHLSQVEGPVEQILAQLLDGTGCTWAIDGNYVLITSGPTSPQMAAGTAQGSGTSAANQSGAVASSPQESTDSTKSLMLYFRFSRTLLERDFMTNRETLAELDRLLSDKNEVSQMIRIDVTGSSSPEGPVALNERIAAERARAVKSYMMWKHPEFDRTMIYTHSIGPDWTGLKEMVESDNDIPNKDRVLEVLSDTDNKATWEERLRAIGGGSFSYMEKNMFRYLRSGAACVILYRKGDSVIEEPVVLIPDAIDTIGGEPEPVVCEEPTPVIEVVPVEPEPVEKQCYWAVKTNLLYDLALLPNLGVEFSLGRKWSLELDAQCAWWQFSHDFYRIQAGGVELRKWFGRTSSTPLHGHYIGLYGMVGQYDIKFGDTGYMSTDPSYSVGLSYGYAMPIARRLNLELGIALGYLSGEYDEYTYDETEDDYPWLRTRDRSYWGPTKAKVSLVWLLGKGTNAKK